MAVTTEESEHIHMWATPSIILGRRIGSEMKLSPVERTTHPANVHYWTTHMKSFGKPSPYKLNSRDFFYTDNEKRYHENDPMVVWLCPQLASLTRCFGEYWYPTSLLIFELLLDAIGILCAIIAGARSSSCISVSLSELPVLATHDVGIQKVGPRLRHV